MTGKENLFSPALGVSPSSLRAPQWFLGAPAARPATKMKRKKTRDETLKNDVLENEPDLQSTDDLGIAHLGRRDVFVFFLDSIRFLKVQNSVDFSNTFTDLLRMLTPCHSCNAFTCRLIVSLCLLPLAGFGAGLCHPGFHPFGHNLKFYTEEPLDQHLHEHSTTVHNRNMSLQQN